MSIDVAALRTVPLFSGVSDKDLKRLAGSLQERTYADGEPVVRPLLDLGVGREKLQGAVEVAAVL